MRDAGNQSSYDTCYSKPQRRYLCMGRGSSFSVALCTFHVASWCVSPAPDLVCSGHWHMSCWYSRPGALLKLVQSFTGVSCQQTRQLVAEMQGHWASHRNGQSCLYDMSAGVPWLWQWPQLLFAQSHEDGLAPDSDHRTVSPLFFSQAPSWRHTILISWLTLKLSHHRSLAVSLLKSEGNIGILLWTSWLNLINNKFWPLPLWIEVFELVVTVM